MDLIVISTPESIPDEHQMVSQILEQTPAIFHLRKPGWAYTELIEYLQQIPEKLHPRIMLHDHCSLLERFELRGIHFTEKRRRQESDLFKNLREKREGFRFSSAFHRMSDIAEFEGTLDYFFLSPNFDSISKPDYLAAFDQKELKQFLSNTDNHVIALAGIHAQRISKAANMGLSGVAVLGAVWDAEEPVMVARHLAEICMRFNERFYTELR